jgi:dolichol kinase
MSDAMEIENGQDRGVQIFRKIFHSLAAPIIPLAYYFELLPRNIIFWLAVLALVIWIPTDLARVYHKGFNEWAGRMFWMLLKDKESGQITGSSYMLIGIVITLSLFEPAIACAALLFNALGDPAAAVVGKGIGRVRFSNGKSLEGVLAMLAVCVAVGVSMIGFGLTAMAGAVSASVMEFFTGKMDDNLTVPLVSGAVMTFTGYGL